MSVVTQASYDHWKRAIDVSVASLGLLLTAPLQIAIGIAVRRTLGPPALFRQQRPGLHGEPFTLIKFRTMRPEGPDRRGVASDSARISRFGSWLRATSLDELPTLWNVLRGDMSIVGPRPLLMSYLERYTPEQSRRHEVRPGLTGLAQIRGRNALAWSDKFAADVEYVDNRGLQLDARILATTVRLVLSRRGVTAENEATTLEFFGTKPDEGK